METETKGTLESQGKVKVPWEGETVDADEIDFKIESGAPLVLQLSDGTKIELEHQISKVYRLSEKRKEDGSPIYLMTGGAKVTTLLNSTENVKA